VLFCSEHLGLHELWQPEFVEQFVIPDNELRLLSKEVAASD